MSTANPFQTGLREHRRKLTRGRQAILDIITQANRHLTPTEIYRKAKAKYPHLGLTTVYRTLDLLVELGYVQRVHLEESCHSYLIATRAHGHHLVCSSCGRAEEFAECDVDALVRALEARTGYAIDVHMLELMGKCPNCQTKTRAHSARKK
jgi:Fur family ferric uptake transcriptional regulator